MPWMVSSPGSDLSFNCITCQKAFDRKDLLNRHQRRCKASSRVSKQKACSACVRTKARCCFTHPACHRCLQRGVQCEYPVHQLPPTDDIATTIALSQVAKPDNHAEHEEVRLATVATPVEPPATSSTGVGQMSTPLLPINTERDTSRLHWNLDVDPSPQSPTNPPWLDFHIDPIEFYFGTASASDAVSTAGALNQSFSVPDGFTTSEDDQNITWNSLGLTSASKTIPYSSGLASGEWDIATGPSISQNAGPLPRDTYDSTNHGSEAEARLFDSLAALDESLLRTAGRGRKRIPLSASDSPARLSMYVPSTASTTETRASNPESIRRSVSSSSSISAMSTLYSLRSSALQPILPIIRGYPKLLLEEDYKSPFIHRKLYRSANHDMTLMAKSNMAICCASALGNVDSAPYIVKAISAERERLIRESHKYSCMEEWDALHAMCVYQIIELLCVEEEDDEMPNLTTAQLHIPFLLKMTRRFAQNHTGDKDFSNTDESDWTEWLVAETVRRTIFLVNIINILASHVNLAASHYFEPLDDTLILDMTLPAPDALWQARTADSWRAAREQLAREGAQEQTLRAILSGAEGRPIDEPEPGSLGLSSSASLANLIIMCAIATTQHHKLIA